jgi:spore maturation protein SpmB
MGVTKTYPQGSPEADRLNDLCHPVLEYLSIFPEEVRITILINLGIGAGLAAGWSPEIMKTYCIETCDVQVAQLKLNKAGAN